MARTPVFVLAAGLAACALCPVHAAPRRVRLPNQYDGSWTIVATTAQGPCASRTRYQVRIKDSDASVPGDEISIEGGVSARGAVQAIITSGANKVPISGSLHARGSGSGTWQTTGGLVACTGSWTAKRSRPST